MEALIILVCLILLFVFGVCSAMFRSMLRAAISLAVISALLSIILFVVGAPWAALFELSVCAGLVTVVFISAISLTTPNRADEAHMREHRSRFAALPFILVFTGIAMLAIMAVTGFNVIPSDQMAPVAGLFKEVFWQTRQADILGQIIIVLAGAFAVVILFKESDKA
jgi:NADH-quinone oxidoreductase subunit J